MFNLRLSKPEDLPDLVRLFDMSNAGITRLAFEKMAQPGEDWIAVGCREMAREDVEFSIQNTITAEVDGKVAGMLIYSVWRQDYPAVDLETLPVSEQAFSLLRRQTGHSLYLRNMAVYEEFRGLRIAAKLLDAVIRTGIMIGVPRVTAIVHDSNVKLLAHYARRGMKEVAREIVREHPVFAPDSYWTLLSSPTPGVLVLGEDLQGVG